MRSSATVCVWNSIYIPINEEHFIQIFQKAKIKEPWFSNSQVPPIFFFFWWRRTAFYLQDCFERGGKTSAHKILTLSYLLFSVWCIVALWVKALRTGEWFTLRCNDCIKWSHVSLALYCLSVWGGCLEVWFLPIQFKMRWNNAQIWLETFGLSHYHKSDDVCMIEYTQQKTLWKSLCDVFCVHHLCTYIGLNGHHRIEACREEITLLPRQRSCVSLGESQKTLMVSVGIVLQGFMQRMWFSQSI